MKAYLKKDPDRIGTILFVYKVDEQKRFTVEFQAAIIDAAADEFEVLDFKEERDDEDRQYR